MQNTTSETPSQATSPVTSEVLVAEFRGLANTMGARFDGIDREVASQRDWLVRLSDAVDRQIQVITKFGALETRLAQAERDISDSKLENEDTSDRVGELEKTDVKRNVWHTVIAAVAGGFVSPILLGIAQAILHAKGLG